MRGFDKVRKVTDLLRSVVRESLEHWTRPWQLVGDVGVVGVVCVGEQVESSQSLLPLEVLGQHSIYCPPQNLERGEFLEFMYPKPLPKIITIDIISIMTNKWGIGCSHNGHTP